MEGRAYTVGRDGHIRINDPSLSRGHAELKFADGKIRLRDLGSTNGTFVFAGNDAVAIDECIVTPDQRIALGSKIYTVKELLALAGVHVSHSDRAGLVVRSGKPDKKAAIDKSDLDALVSREISDLFD